MQVLLPPRALGYPRMPSLKLPDPSSHPKPDLRDPRRTPEFLSASLLPLSTAPVHSTWLDTWRKTNGKLDEENTNFTTDCSVSGRTRPSKTPLLGTKNILLTATSSSLLTVHAGVVHLPGRTAWEGCMRQGGRPKVWDERQRFVVLTVAHTIVQLSRLNTHANVALRAGILDLARVDSAKGDIY